MSYPIGRLATTEPTRGLTAACWRQSLEKYDGKGSMADHGVSDIDDFQHFLGTIAEGAARDGWSVEDVNTSTATLVGIADPTGNRGTAQVTESGTTQHLGSSVFGPLNVKLPSHASEPRGRTVFAYRGEVVDDGTLFAGLSTALPLSATSTLLTTVGRIGFYKVDDGDIVFASLSASGGTADVTVALADIAAGSRAYYKLEFAVNPDLTVEIFVNGVYQQAASIAFNSASLPTGTLRKNVVITNGDGTSGTAEVDYVCVHNEA